MPFPLIAVATIGALGASVGLQAYDTFNKEAPITVQTYRSQPKQTAENPQKYLPIIALAGAAILVLFMVMK